MSRIVVRYHAGVARTVAIIEPVEPGIHHDIWLYCWSLTGDRYLADKATQETCLRTTTAIGRFRCGCSS